MNDELMTLTDARGRAAGSALQRASTVRSWTASAPKRPVVWLRPALLTAAVVAVIAGLVWVTGRPTEPVDQRDPAGLRYLIGELPTGWGAPVAQETETSGSTSDMSNIRLSSFGTPGDATAPMLQLVWQDLSKQTDISLGGVLGLSQFDDLREIAVGDDVAACANLGTSLRCVLNTTEGFLQSTSVSLSDDEVARLLSAVEFVDGDTVIGDADLAEGMAQLSRGGLEQSPVLWAPVKVPGASQVIYASSTDDGSLLLTTGWAAENDLAGVATWGEMKRVDFGGHSAFMGVSPLMGASGLFWVDGVRAFALVTSDASVDLLAVAASVRPATSDEWAAIVVETPEGTNDTTPADGTTLAVPETTVLGEPAETGPPVSASTPTGLRDVAVTQTVRPISEFDASYSSELPDGVFGEVQIAVVADTVLAREASGIGSAFEWGLDRVAFTEVTPYFYDNGNGNDGVIAVSTDPAALQLRVTRLNGDRYLLDLVPVRNHPDLKVGVVVLPPSSFIAFDVVDVDGNVLASWDEVS